MKIVFMKRSMTREIFWTGNLQQEKVLHKVTKCQKVIFASLEVRKQYFFHFFKENMAEFYCVLKRFFADPDNYLKVNFSLIQMKEKQFFILNHSMVNEYF